MQKGQAAAPKKEEAMPIGMKCMPSSEIINVTCEIVGKDYIYDQKYLGITPLDMKKSIYLIVEVETEDEDAAYNYLGRLEEELNTVLKKIPGAGESCYLMCRGKYGESCTHILTDGFCFPRIPGKSRTQYKAILRAFTMAKNVVNS